jgi:hypothetical protein
MATMIRSKNGCRNSVSNARHPVMSGKHVAPFEPGHGSFMS